MSITHKYHRRIKILLISVGFPMFSGSVAKVTTTERYHDGSGQRFDWFGPSTGLELSKPCFILLQSKPVDYAAPNTKMAIENILREHSVRFLQNMQHSKLYDMYHDLDADAELQKNALIEGFILLNPWELLVLSLFKALTEPSFIPNLE